MGHYPYRTHPTLQRSHDAWPRWVAPVLVASAVVLGLTVVSRAVSVASIDSPGPPPIVVAAR